MNINFTIAHSFDNSTGLSKEGVGGHGGVPNIVDKLTPAQRS